MSEIPKRVWLVGPCDESPGWDEGIHQDGSRGELFISAAALRELAESLRNDAIIDALQGYRQKPGDGHIWAAKQIERLLEASDYKRRNDMDKMKLIEAIITGDCGTPASSPLPFKVGEQWFFRTVTHHQTGRIRSIHGKFLVLDDCAWIADSGRFADALKNGTLNEVEPMPNGSVVNTDSLIDASPWSGALPTVQK